MLPRLLAIFITLLVSSLPAQAGRLVDMEVINRSSGETLTTYPHRGQRYVAGNPGDRYALRLINRSNQRVMVVLSVDGVNVVSGETATFNQSGYVLAPWEQADIAGWRKNEHEIAQFYFTSLPDSYAVRTDRPDNVGVIGAAVFREKVYPPIQMPSPASRENRVANSADSMSNEASGLAPQSMRKSERLGTGHGQREHAPIQYTEFERASQSAAEVITLRYNSRANLAAHGIIPKPRPTWRKPDWQESQPFPGQFVPDPRS
jgi:hypothetical protein